MRHASWRCPDHPDTGCRSRRAHRAAATRLPWTRRRSRGCTPRCAPAGSPAAALVSVSAPHRGLRQDGPAINAIVVVNPRALDEADCSIARFKQSGPTGPLHCIPIIVKDNFETSGLQSADGSLALEGFVSRRTRSRCSASRSGRDRAREVEHGGVGVHAIRDRELDPARLHEESVCARPRDRRIERRNRRRRRRQFRRSWTWQRHRQLHSRPVVASGAGGHPLDDGAHEPRRRRAAQPAADIAGPMARTVRTRSRCSR